MIRLIVIQADDRAWSFASFYHPFILNQASFNNGRSEAKRVSISAQDVSTYCWRSVWRLALIWNPRRNRSHWSCMGYWHMETIVLKILHVEDKIHAFPLAPWAVGLSTAFQSYVKIRPYPVSTSEGRKGRIMHHLRYCECYLRLDMRRHPRII